MKILHTSQSGLPDPRVEKTALTMKKEGHELFFLGGGPSRTGTMDVFDGTSEVPMVNSLKLALDSRFRRKWLRAIAVISPDVVHAHNIIAAAMMFETDYPVIYDDHEYWSKQAFKFSERGLLRRVASIPLARKIPKWEREAFERYPVITVSDMNAKDHRRYAKDVTVTRNFPLLAETGGLKDREDRVGNVYVGNDFELRKFLPHRDMTGLKDLISFDILKGLKHDALMERLTRYRVGLTPWKPHSLHEYADPNRNYEYLGAGLQIVISESLIGPIRDNPYILPFRNYSEIPEILQNLPETPGSKIMDHARKHYVWENQEHLIRDVYKRVLS